MDCCTVHIVHIVIPVQIPGVCVTVNVRSRLRYTITGKRIQLPTRNICTYVQQYDTMVYALSSASSVRGTKRTIVHGPWYYCKKKS